MKRHIAALDGLQGIAALCVVALHMSDGTSLGRIPPRAHLAVDFFFVLSGFVIALAYDAKLVSGMSGVKFFQVRFVRLYPLIFLGTLLGFAAHLFIFHIHGPRPLGPQSYRGIVIGLAFGLVLLPYLGTAESIFPLDTPIWSLMFEALANVVYAIIRQFRSWLVAAIVGCSAVVLAVASDAYNGLNATADTPELLERLARVRFSFFVGILIFRSAHLFDRLPTVPFWLLGVALIGSFCVPASWRFGWIYEIGAIVLIFPLIVALGAKCIVKGGGAALALFGSRISYSVYVLHFPVLVHVSHIRTSNLAEPIGLIVAGVIVMAAVGWGASAYYDEPVRRWLNARLNGGERIKSSTLPAAQ